MEWQSKITIKYISIKETSSALYFQQIAIQFIDFADFSDCRQRLARFERSNDEFLVYFQR